MISGYSGKTKPKPGAQIDLAHPLSRGLVGCWLFNEGAGSQVNDISGRGNHSTLKNMAPNVQGSGWGGSTHGGGLHFDGGDDYVNVPHNPTLNFGTGDFTISLWLNPSSWTSGDIIFNKGSDAASNEYIMYYYEGSNIGVFAEMGDVAINYASGMTLSTGQWHHIVLLRRGNTGYVYFDNIQMDSANVAGFDSNSTNDLYIGTSLVDLFFHGIMDTVHIYNRALSAMEIEKLYYHPFCNILKPRYWYVPSTGPAGSIPVIMDYYKQLRRS